MRKRIKQLARGKFEYAKPQLQISEEETVIEKEQVKEIIKTLALLLILNEKSFST